MCCWLSHSIQTAAHSKWISTLLSTSEKDFLLALWTIYEGYIAFVTKQATNSIAGDILVIVLVFEGIYEQILKHQMVEDDEEYKEPNKALLTVLVILVAVALIVTFGSILLFK